MEGTVMYPKHVEQVSQAVRQVCLSATDHEDRMAKAERDDLRHARRSRTKQGNHRPVQFGEFTFDERASLGPMPEQEGPYVRQSPSTGDRRKLQQRESRRDPTSSRVFMGDFPWMDRTGARSIHSTGHTRSALEWSSRQAAGATPPGGGPT